MSRQLPYVVECKSTFAFFEPIAAFNVESVAKDYADSCAFTNPRFEYRVKSPKSKKGHALGCICEVCDKEGEYR